MRYERARNASQLSGTVCAKMGNGVSTLEIIPAEIESRLYQCLQTRLDAPDAHHSPENLQPLTD